MRTIHLIAGIAIGLGLFGQLMQPTSGSPWMVCAVFGAIACIAANAIDPQN